MADPRSRESEEYALGKLGFLLCVEEDALIREYSQMHIRVPEGIFYDPNTKRRVTVEVKRLISNELPCDKGKKERRKVVERGRVIWPWKKTVHSAFEKAHPTILRDYGATEHHVVFLTPESLDKRKHERLVKRALHCSSEVAQLVSVRTRVHFITAPDSCFDRF